MSVRMKLAAAGLALAAMPIAAQADTSNHAAVSKVLAAHKNASHLSGWELWVLILLIAAAIAGAITAASNNSSPKSP